VGHQAQGSTGESFHRRLTRAFAEGRYLSLQVTGTRAAKLELAGSFDAAFEQYVKAAQSYLFLIRHCADPETKGRLRAVSGKLVERAGRIKQAKKDLIRPVARDRLSIGVFRDD
jgi:hypothetical protein